MPSVATTVSTLFATAQLVAGAAYTLTDNYNQANFFDSFEFFSEADPTKGFVQYQNKVNAAAQGLAGFHQDMIYVGSDHKTANPANGRASTRLNSKKSYTQMLLVADVVHMPVVSQTTCSTGSFYLPTLAKASGKKISTNPWTYRDAAPGPLCGHTTRHGRTVARSTSLRAPTARSPIRSPSTQALHAP